MSVQTSYPGVYVQEVPSGVRTITGVSTSVTAFVGTAKRGSINRAIQIFSYADFERRFGGLSKDMELGYAVRQFFLSGGTQAIIVRLAKDPVTASTELENGGSASVKVLKIEALDAGKDGNNIEIRISHSANNPDSHFNLTVNYTSADNPSDSKSEFFENLSMNHAHPRFVERRVNNFSSIVKVATMFDPTTITDKGTSESGDLSTLAIGDIDATHNKLRVVVNGLEPVAIQLPVPLADLAAVCTAIKTQVKNVGTANSEDAWIDFDCTESGGIITLTSGVGGENSRVEVLSGLGADATARLKLGLANGGKEIDAVAALRPQEIPNNGTLISGNIASLPGSGSKFRISIDGRPTDEVAISITGLAGANELATRIQNAVRALKPSIPGYNAFTCTASSNGASFSLTLASGSRGTGSSILVSAAPGDTLAETLKLLSPEANQSLPNNFFLAGGSESSFTDSEAYNIYIGSQADRTGIYALESADIFNILCLPGINDPGILMDSEAYCRSRRAFMIIDAPRSAKRPEDMKNAMAGADLPKSDHAAVYFPWIEVSDPLNGGQPRLSAPCGVLAGLYARIDSNRGVWKAAAGTEATLTGVRRLEYPLTDGENGLLNPLGVNCLRIFPASGPISWGARTLAGNDQLASEWKYIPVRRTALFIEESLYRGLKWVVFEPNDEPLWSQIRLNVGAFMHNLFRQGAFQGQKRDDAYFVKCDKETTTQNDINLGIVNIWVGFAPLKPAEFVILYLQQMTGQIQV